MSGKIIIGAILVILGISSLLQINIWPLLWPFLLIFLGVRIIAGRGEESGGRWDEVVERDEDEMEETVIFNGINRRVISDNFKGGRVTSIFGGGQIDLSEAKIAKGETAVVEVTTIFGGIKLIVPNRWRVNEKVVGIAGGFENNTSSNPEAEESLRIAGTAIFGGGEVVNKTP